MATTIVAARIDDEVKRRADKVLAAAQLTPTQLVRRVYDYLATVGDVPEFVKVDESCVVLDVEDPVLSQLSSIFSLADSILSDYAPLPELTQEDVEETFLMTGFDERMMEIVDETHS